MEKFFNLLRLDFITDFFERFLTYQGSYAPILLLILEEAGVPLPLPGDVIIMYTGYQVSNGNVSYVLAFLLLLVSVLIGSSILFFLSVKYGQYIVLKFGRYMHIDEKKIAMVKEKFRKYGPLVIIFGRHIPGFRIPITIFAGMSEITYKTFITSTFISIIFWIPFYLGLGQNLGAETLRLIRGRHEYLLIALIPLVVFIISLFYISIQRKKKNNNKK